MELQTEASASRTVIDDFGTEVILPAASDEWPLPAVDDFGNELGVIFLK